MTTSTSSQHIATGATPTPTKATSPATANAADEQAYTVRPATLWDARAIAKLSSSEFGAEIHLWKKVEYRIRVGRTQGYSVSVATDHNQQVAGFTLGLPQDLEAMRYDGQVALLQQVVVAKKHRGRGLGKLLVDNSIEVNREMGFSRLLVQFRPGLADWYARLGWTVLPVDHVNAWIEPPLTSEAKIAPMTCMLRDPKYPQIAYTDIGPRRPIVHVQFDGRLSRFQTTSRSTFELSESLAASVDLLLSVPPFTLVSLFRSNNSSPRFKKALNSLMSSAAE